MRILQHKSCVNSVAFAPDGTLFVLTAGDELWAYPADGSERVYVANTRHTSWTNQYLAISPDGRWLSVSGGKYPVLYEVGSLAPVAGSSRKRGLVWQKDTVSGEGFQGWTEFTGDSTFWVGRVDGSSLEVPVRLYCRPLSGSQAFHFPAASVPQWNHFATVPGTPVVILSGWSAESKALCHWRVDLTRLERPAEQLGSSEHGGWLTVSADGRLFLLSAARGLGVYSQNPDGLHLDFAVHLPGFDNVPTLVLSGDGRRFVARDLMSKLVYAGDTATGELFGPWEWNIGVVNGVAIAPNGLTAAAAGSSKKVAVWDLE
jgi:hypothetical protein